MNSNMIQELMSAAGIPDDDAPFYEIMEQLADSLPYCDWLALENAVNLRVGRAIEAAFRAGMAAGASCEEPRRPQ